MGLRCTFLPNVELILARKFASTEYKFYDKVLIRIPSILNFLKTDGRTDEGTHPERTKDDGRTDEVKLPEKAQRRRTDEGKQWKKCKGAKEQSRMEEFSSRRKTKEVGFARAETNIEETLYLNEMEKNFHPKKDR